MIYKSCLEIFIGEAHFVFMPIVILPRETQIYFDPFAVKPLHIFQAWKVHNIAVGTFLAFKRFFQVTLRFFAFPFPRRTLVCCCLVPVTVMQILTNMVIFPVSADFAGDCSSVSNYFHLSAGEGALWQYKMDENSFFLRNRNSSISTLLYLIYFLILHFPTYIQLFPLLLSAEPLQLCSLELLLFCLVAVVCLAEVSLFCSDGSVVTLHRSTLPSSPNYCEYRISSFIIVLHSSQPTKMGLLSRAFRLIEGFAAWGVGSEAKFASKEYSNSVIRIIEFIIWKNGKVGAAQQENSDQVYFSSRWSTVSRLSVDRSADSRSTVDRRIDRQSADNHRLSVDCRQTRNKSFFCRLAADGRLTSDCRATVDRSSTDCRPNAGRLSSDECFMRRNPLGL